MHIKAVIDKKGRLVAAVYPSGPAHDEGEQTAPRMGPVVEDGHTLVEIGVPDELATYPLRHFVERVESEVRAQVEKKGAR